MGDLVKTNPALAKFQVLKDSADQLAIQVASIKVTDETTEAIATQIVSKARGFEKLIDEKRVELKAPSLKAGKEIDAAAKMILEELKLSIVPAREEILSYRKKVEQKRLEAEEVINKLNAELRRTKEAIIERIDAATKPEELKAIFMELIKPFKGPEHWTVIADEAVMVLQEVKAYGSAKKAMLLNPEKAIEVKAIQADIIQNMEVINETAGENKLAELEMAKTNGMTTLWKFEVVDITKVKKHFLTVDSALVKAFSKEYRAAGTIVKDCVIDGIRYYPEKSLVIR